MVSGIDWCFKERTNGVRYTGTKEKSREHIPEKHIKMVRYFGIHERREKKGYVTGNYSVKLLYEGVK